MSSEVTEKVQVFSEFVKSDKSHQKYRHFYLFFLHTSINFCLRGYTIKEVEGANFSFAQVGRTPSVAGECELGPWCGSWYEQPQLE